MYTVNGIQAGNYAIDIYLHEVSPKDVPHWQTHKVLMTPDRDGDQARSKDTRVVFGYGHPDSIGSPCLGFAYCKNGVCTAIATDTSTDGTGHTLTLAKYGNTFYAFLDYELKWTFTDPDLGAMSMWMGKFTGDCWEDSESTSWWDNLKIRKYTDPEPTLTFSAEYPVVRTALTLRKSVSPYSIKQGQKANVIITVENAGTTTLYDIEVVDAPPAEFEFVSGDTSAKYTALKPGESRTFSYVIKSVSAGKFDLGKAKATYADEEGNYHTVESNAPMIEVLAPLITPEIPSEEKKIPGFEIASALAAIFAVARMRGRRRK